MERRLRKEVYRWRIKKQNKIDLQEIEGSGDMKTIPKRDNPNYEETQTTSHLATFNNTSSDMISPQLISFYTIISPKKTPKMKIVTKYPK